MRMQDYTLLTVVGGLVLDPRGPGAQGPGRRADMRNVRQKLTASHQLQLQLQLKDCLT